MSDSVPIVGPLPGVTVAQEGFASTGDITAGHDPAPVTKLLHAAVGGEKQAADQLLRAVYDQLLAIARNRMSRENPDHTLQPTALVHEAYLKLVGSQAINWSSRAHFFHASAQAMRRILIDHARSCGRVKRGGNMRRKSLDAIDMALSTDGDDILALDAAVTQLAERDERAATIVQFRFYAGLSVEDTAAAMNLSERTVKREWAFARAWLYKQIESE